MKDEVKCTVGRRCAYLALLIGCASISQVAPAQAPPPGVFAEARNAIVSLPGPALEPTTIRSRVVQVDTRKIAAARRGREVLKLNLFDDTVVEVNIRKTRPTRTGHFIFGSPRGMEWGEVRLVVNGPVMVGTVVTPKGEFTIRSTRAGLHVIRQVDPTLPFECGVDEVTVPDRPGLPAVSSIDPAAAGAPSSPVVHADETPTEDGSEVRVLVVYTPALQAEQGGAAGMRALVDLMIQSANQAFEEGGIRPRLVLAHTAMVDYVSAGSNSDVSRLINKDDGYLDEVHALRNRYAADLVHLLTNVVVRASGSASRPTRETLFTAEHSAFGATGNGSEITFTHEIGHNFGLRHDRYVNTPSFTVYPYAFGYTNQAAFEPGAPDTARWRTVMSYGNQCSDANFGCTRLLRFSNPDQTRLGDPMGVAADVAATGTDGPADARLTINNMGRWVGSFRSEACTDFRVSPGTQVAPKDGGDLVFQVTAGPGCLWESSSQSGFLSIVSGTRSAGNGHVRVKVQENGSGAARNGNLTVAGYNISVRQLATETGICGRSPAVAQEIARAAGYSGSSQCDQVSEADLAGITTLSVAGKSLFSLKADDFAGLSGLTDLSLNSNELTELPDGVFSDLVSLTSLNLGYNELTELPAGLFAGLASLEELDLESNRLITLPDGLFADLAGLKQLEMDYNDLNRLPQGLFAGLSGLELISMYSSDLDELPAGLFTGLSSLKELNLGQNQLTELPAAAFAGLSSIEILNLFSNELASLPAGLFAGLSNLTQLDLGQGKFVTLPEGLFGDLSRLEVLNFWDSRLARLSSGGFTGLSNLRQLNLYSSRLTELPSGAFAGLSKLEQLNLGGNEIGRLPGDIFSGLGALRQLNLFRNRLTSLPDGIFSGLNTLETLQLGANLRDPLPLPLSLEKAGDSGFKAVVSTGAPFALELPVSVGSAGEIEGGAAAVSIPAGEMESATLTVTRVAGTEDAVEVEFGTLPGLPADHTGYAFVEDESLPRRIHASSLADDAALNGISVSEGTLNPVFSPETLEYTALVSNRASSVTVLPVKSNADATVAWLDGGDQPLADADAGADGQQVNLSIGENTIKVQVTAADGATRRTYTLTVTRDSATDVCSRTPQVRDAILAASGVADCSDVTAANLAGITRISIFGEKSLSLKSGDFSGLTALRSLGMRYNGLTELPADVFLGLAALEELYLNDNQISSLPDGVFSGLPAIEQLYLTENRLTDLPPDVFSGLSELASLSLSQNQFTVLPADVFRGLTKLERLNLSHNQLAFPSTEIFSGLTALESLLLHRNQLRSLPGGLFSGLSNLGTLYLSDNRLTSLPSGIFSGLTMLETLYLDTNSINPLPIPLSIEKAGENQFRVLLPAGAPFALEMPVLVNSAGEIEGGATAATIPAGATESALLTVARVSGTTDPVTADIGPAPDLPSGHKGYFFERNAALPREILASPAPARDAALRRLSASGGTLDPAFASGTTSYTLRVANATASVTLTEERSNAGASVSFLDANDQALADADTTLAGHQVNLSTGVNTIRLRVTSEDTSTTRTYSIVVTRNTLPEITTTSPLSVSENQTAVATLAATDADSDAISWLTNGGADSGRFDLTGDGVLTFSAAPDYEAPADLDRNNEYLVTVEASDGSDSSYLALAVTVTDADESAPASDNASLSTLELSDGTLSPAFASGTVNYTATVGAGVASITVTPTTSEPNAIPKYLDENDNEIDDADGSADGQQVNLEVGENTIKVRITAEDATTTQTYTVVVTREAAPVTSQGVCDRTKQVGEAIVAAVSEASACADVTARHLSGITGLDVSGEEIATLTSGDFAGLTALELLKLSDNDLTALPAGIFSGLGALDTLELQDNRIANLPSNVFASLAGLESLVLSNNRLSGLPANVFSGLADLQTLELEGNRLSSLPDGVFSGLESLSSLKLGGNTVDPLPLSVTLEKAGVSEFRAVAATGSPFRLVLPVSASSAGEIAGGATSVTIDTGRDESAPVEVTRVAETRAAVTVDFGTLPGLPSDHSGYAFTKSTALPLEVLAAVPAQNDDATLSGLSLSDGTLDPVFAPGTKSYTATVRNAVSSITVTPTRSDGNAGLEYQDGSDTALVDGDGNTSGFQIDLDQGENTVKIKVTAEDDVATETYAVIVTRNRPPQITTTSPISVEEENTFIANLQATDADDHALSWYVVAGADRDQFELTAEGNLSFKSAPDFESPADSDENNVYLIEVGVTDRFDPRSLSLIVNVTDADEPVSSSDARLTGLSVSGATLSPAFGSGTTGYTATVGNAVSSVTVTPTGSDGDASLEFLDGNDSELEDSDGNASGHQVDLGEGANTIKVKVTAEDGDTMRTYTIVVTRNSVPQITTASPVSVDENETDVAALAATDADGDDIAWSKNGGADEAQFDLTSQGVLTFVSAPDYESPADADTSNDYVVAVRASDGIDASDLTLTVNVTDVEERSLSTDATLSGLSLSEGTLDPVFASGTTSYTARVRASTASVTVTPAKGDSNATIAYLDGNDGALEDADGNASGHQVDLSPGGNTVKVQVTAEDGDATRTYTVVVTRNRAPVVTTTSPVSVEENSTLVASLGATDADSDELEWYFTGGEDRSLFNLTAAGELTFKSAPDYENPADDDGGNDYEVVLGVTDLLDPSPLTLTVNVTDVEERSLSTDATLSGLSLSEGTLDPVFASGTTSYTASVGNTVSSITVTPAKNDGNARVEYLDEDDGTLEDADGNTQGLQVDLSVGANTVKVKVTAEDTTTTRTYEIVVTRASATSAGICARTQQVRDAIVAALSDVDACDDVTASDLASITSLDLTQKSITSLKSGDFNGLTALTELELNNNRISDLPSDIFSALTSVTSIKLRNNRLTSLPSGLFSGLTKLETIHLGINSLGTIPSGLYSGLTSLKSIELISADLTSLPSDVFSGLTALESIEMFDNELDSLPSGLFSGLTKLRTLRLSQNNLSSLSSNTFSGLTSLFTLSLGSNEFSSLPSDVFSGLNSLFALSLNHNDLEALPADIFSGLNRLAQIQLQNNELETLPDGIFSGLIEINGGGLAILYLEDNPGSPFSIPLSLEAVGTSQFKVVISKGAPFTMEVPVSAGGDGGIEGDADAVRMVGGSIESGAVGVTRVRGTTTAVTVDIGTLPELPPNHKGYALEKDSSLPLAIASPTEVDPPRRDDATLSGLSLSDGTLDPAFAPGTTSYTASVGNTVSSITVTPAKSDDDATVEYLDVRDDTLGDADSGTEGQQASLSIGRNTIRVKVTSEDTTATETYEIVVTRGSATGVCARTEQVRDEIVDTVSGVDACEDVTEAHLASITQLDLISSNISSLQAGDFSGLSGLEILYIFNNKLKGLPTGIFSGLTDLAVIEMSINELSSLDSQVFSGLTNLEVLDLYDNEIASLPSGIFSGLTSLEDLYLNSNALTDLPSGIFSGLTALTQLKLRGNKFSSLDANLFSGLTALELLWLDRNQLSSLPSGIFSGLDGLTYLKLESNTVDPLPLTVSLEKVGSSQFKAVAPIGAPFAAVLPVTVSSGGEIDGGAGSVTIAAGAVESGAVGITRVSGTTAAVTVNIGTLPGLPANHSGYALEKDDSLPLEVLAEQSGAPGEGIAADASFADVNGNGRIEADDAMIIYHAIESAAGLGDGETGGTPSTRATVLAGLAGAADWTDDDLREMLRNAKEWREVGVEVGGDLNGDSAIGGDDAMIMYYAYEFEDLLGDGETGGTARFRRSLLSELAARPVPGDADLKALLRNAHALRSAVP